MLDRPAFLNVTSSFTGRRWVGPGLDDIRRAEALTQALDLTLLPRDDGLALHLTGTNFFDPLQEAPEWGPPRFRNAGRV